MKTLKEFDYDLWAAEEGGKKRYYARVKATGEETEISQELMRFLFREEKRMRRSMEKERCLGRLLSLDCIQETESGLEEYGNCEMTSEAIAIANIMEQEFMKLLTELQKEIYLRCMRADSSITAFAESRGLDSSTVYEARDAIRKKFKKFFG